MVWHRLASRRKGSQVNLPQNALRSRLQSLLYLLPLYSLQAQSERRRMTKVKICGITTRADARVAVEAGADMIGLSFFPPSPRYVTPEQAQAIVMSLPADVPAVGVFVNASVDTVTRVAQTSGVQIVQLHGDESPEMCRQVPWRVVKAFRFTAQV